MKLFSCLCVEMFISISHEIYLRVKPVSNRHKICLVSICHKFNLYLKQKVATNYDSFHMASQSNSFLSIGFTPLEMNYGDKITYCL